MAALNANGSCMACDSAARMMPVLPMAAQALIVGNVIITPGNNNMTVQFRLYNVFGQSQQFARQYSHRCRRLILAATSAGAVQTWYTLPLDAVSRLEESQYVYIVKDGKAHQVPVELGARADNRVELAALLTHLRHFGYCFNPVSFYYGYAEDGTTLDWILAEITNTPWGERHCYVHDGNGGNNYSISTNSAAGSISQAALTLDAVTDSKTYDGTLSAAGAGRCGVPAPR